MKKEVYFWIIVFILAVGAGLFFRYYKPPINMLVGFNYSAPATIYPYQKVVFPIFVQNNGGSVIDRLNFEVKVNGNITTFYQITVPAGKVAYFQYNMSPSAPGVYNITVVADPGSVYNIQNRQNAWNRTIITVVPQQNSSQNTLLPAGNVISKGSNNFGNTGYVVSSFLYSNYGVGQFAPLGNNTFLGSVLNVTQSYLRNVSVTYAQYRDGDYAYSIWISGYLDPSVMGTAAYAKGLTPKYYQLNGANTTFLSLGRNATLCSWYSMGWIKNLVYKNTTKTCLAFVNATGFATNVTLNGSQKALYSKLFVPNGVVVGGFSGTNGVRQAYSAVEEFGNQFFSPSILVNSNVSRRCLGVISNVAGNSYCSSYVYQSGGSLNNSIALIRTSSTIGNYNVSVFSLVNVTLVFQSVPIAVSLIRSFNLTGPSTQFVSGFGNRCAFNNSFPCSNVTFGNSIVRLSLMNNLSRSVRLNSLRCIQSGYTGNATILGRTLNGTKSVLVNATCYNNGVKVYGIPLNLQLALWLNYTYGNTTKVLRGNATANFFSG